MTPAFFERAVGSNAVNLFVVGRCGSLLFLPGDDAPEPRTFGTSLILGPIERGALPRIQRLTVAVTPGEASNLLDAKGLHRIPPLADGGGAIPAIDALTRHL